MTFHVERIDHVVLRCRDLPGMVRFYEQALGFNVERKLDRISLVQMRAGASLLDLIAAERPSEAALRRAVAYGTVLASFNVEEFGTERVSRLSREEIEERFEALRQMTQFEALPPA